MIKKMSEIIAIIVIIISATSFVAAQDVTEEKSPLRVGITPDYPPIIFEQGDSISGVEADLARLLAQQLNRPLKFVQLRWEEQIPGLLNKKIDIIMSGMSVTKEREVRIRFADYYMKSGLVAAMLAENKWKYQSLEDILNTYGTVGVVKGTTSEGFVNKSFSHATQKSILSKPSDGLSELESRRIDLFVNDMPSIIWLVSENEMRVAGFWQPLNEEYLAWGVRKGDDVFLKQVNTVLQRWKQDGTLNDILKKWLPAQYLERVK